MTDPILSGNLARGTKKFHKWNIGQINIQSCSDDHRLHTALQECRRANLDVICFQEVRQLNTGSVKHLGYTFYWSGLKRFKRYGVGIAIKNNSDIVINGVIYFSARLMAADLTVRGCKVRIVSGYAPTLSGTSLALKQQFYRDLSNISKVERHRKLMVMGDFNAEPQFCRTHARYDARTSRIDDGIDLTNENVRLFLQYCGKLKLSILNTWFDHPIHHRVSWHHPNGTTAKVYDYALSESWMRQFVTNVRVKNSYFNSDHRLVVINMKTPANKAARQFNRKRGLGKPNLQELLNETTKAKFLKAIQVNLQKDSNSTLTSNSIDCTHNRIIEALNEGRKQIPSQPRQTRGVIPWDQDPMLSKLHQSRINIRKLPNNSTTKENLKQINKQVKVRVTELQNKIWQSKGKLINDAKQHRNIVKLWKHAKNHDSSEFSKTVPLQCPGIASHFRQHFNPDHSSVTMPHEITNTPDYIKILQDSTETFIEEPPSREEIKEAINQLNNGKSSLDVEAEVIKAGSELSELLDNLEIYFKTVWTNKEVPKQWTISRITPIWKKKGNAMDPTKYRGISIGSVLCKIGINIILKRLSKFYENQLMRTQFGFRSGVGCNDGVYMIKQLQEIASKSRRKLYICFVDLTAAFDHVNRNLLFQTIRKRLSANQVCTNIEILEKLYQSTKSFMQNANPDQESFETTSGVRQGGQEGPPLYNLYSDFVLRVYENKKVAAGVIGLQIPYHIPNEATNRSQRSEAPASGICDDDCCGYADDVAVLCWSETELQICMTIFYETFNDFGLNLNLNPSKTETMIMNWNTAQDGIYPQSILSINGKNINNVTSFKYLGVWINNSDIHIGKEEVQHRVASAHNAFSEHRKLLTNKSIKLDTRITFLKALVRSRLTYGCHAWRPSLQEMNKFDTTYRFFLRCMVWNGHARINPPPRDALEDDTLEETYEDDSIDWRYTITNQKLYQLTRTGTIQEFYRAQQNNWVSHLIRRNNNNICKILTFNTTTRTKQGRKIPSILERAVQHSGKSLEEYLRSSFIKSNLQVHD